MKKTTFSIKLETETHSFPAWELSTCNTVKQNSYKRRVGVGTPWETNKNHATIDIFYKYVSTIIITTIQRMSTSLSEINLIVEEDATLVAFKALHVGYLKKNQKYIWKYILSVNYSSHYSETPVDKVCVINRNQNDTFIFIVLMVTCIDSPSMRSPHHQSLYSLLNYKN